MLIFQHACCHPSVGYQLPWREAIAGLLESDVPIEPSPAVLRACDLLAHLARHPTESFSISELARLAEVPRATCDAILQALAAHGYAARHEEDRRYRLGPGGIALGEAAQRANPMLEAAQDEAGVLARSSGSFVAVSVREGVVARVAAVFDFAPLFALRARIGQTIPLVPPFGAVFVAWSRAEEHAWLGRASATLKRSERARYRRALSEVRRRGYSLSVLTRRLQAFDPTALSADVDVGAEARDRLLHKMMHSDYLAVDLEPEATVRVAQISAPVFDGSGRATMSLLLPGPDYEVRRGDVDDLASHLVEAARRATRRAGGRMPASAISFEAAESTPREA